eukprot:scaffold33787_cov18-Tisochrysis_lutea.AAC.1
MSGGLPLPKYHPERQREPGMHPEKCAILIQPFKTQWKPGAHHLLFCFNHSEIASLDCAAYKVTKGYKGNDDLEPQAECASQDQLRRPTRQSTHHRDQLRRPARQSTHHRDQLGRPYAMRIQGHWHHA